MRGARTAGAWLLAAALAAALVAAPARPAAAQGLPPDEKAARAALREGTHVFRRMLYDMGYEQGLKNFDRLDKQPEETLLIVLGWTGKLAELPGGLKSYLDRGGALLLATDRWITPDSVRKQVVDVAGVTVAGESVVSTRYCYKGQSFCPYLAWWEPDPILSHKLSSGVATNVPSYLKQETNPLPHGLRKMAFLPPPDGNSVPPLFAVGGDVGKGRVLVLADHSIFINEMMLPEDTSNVEFAGNCLNYLRGDEGTRKHVLFIEDGTIQTKLDIKMKRAPGVADLLRFLWSQQPELVALGNEALGRLEEDGNLNHMVLDQVGDLDDYDVDTRGRYRRRVDIKVQRILLLAATLALVVFAIYRVGMRGRARQEGSVPALGPAARDHLPIVPLAAQRHLALLRGGNLWAPAREAARQALSRLGVGPAGPPRIEVEGGWWLRWRRRRQARRLWALAFGPRPVRVSQRAYRRLLAELEQLRVAVARGAVRLVSAQPTGAEGRGG
jgi:hypothetical protein